MKWLSGLAKLTLAAIFLTVVSLYATWVAVQTYLDRILAHYQIGGDMKSVEFSDFLANVGMGLNIMNQSTSKKTDQTAAENGLASANQPNSQRDEGGGNSSGLSGESGEDGQTTGQEEAPAGSGSTEEDGMTDALPVWSQSGQSAQAQSQQSRGEAAERQTVVSSEHVTSTKDKMTNEDKMKLFSLLVSKLPPTEMQTISELMEDGITKEELEEIDAIVQKYMTQEEYKQMLEILEKYQ